MLGVDESGPLKNAHEVIKIAMNVTDGDYVFRFIRRGFGRSRPCQANQHQEQEGGDTSTVTVSRERRAEHFPASCSRGLRILQESHCIPQGIPYGVRILGCGAVQVNKLK
jgi:hypothetical protein